jgi:pimeloyl-ACP methyl ester carboxylesterase
VEDLRALLKNAGVEPPYVLAGESYGGAVMQVYASLYPQDVVGMVQVDAVTRSMDSRYPEKYLQNMQINRQVISAFSVPGLFRLMNWFGMSRIFPAFEKLPPDLREIEYALAYNSRMGENMKAENATRLARDAQFMSAAPLPDIPMIVLVHDLENSIQGVVADETSRLAEQAWQDAQAELAKQVTDGTLIVAKGSGHMITLEKPGVVIDAIREVMAQVR